MHYQTDSCMATSWPFVLYRSLTPLVIHVLLFFTESFDCGGPQASVFSFEYDGEIKAAMHGRRDIPSMLNMNTFGETIAAIHDAVKEPLSTIKNTPRHTSAVCFGALARPHL